MSTSNVKVHCAPWAREAAIDPGGTAPEFDVFVLVEHPLPWPRDIGDDHLLEQLGEIAAQHAGRGRTVRLQMTPVAREQSMRRVVVFDRGRGPFSGYGRSEGSASVDKLPQVVASLVDAPVPPSSTLEATDVLICTHGARDRCCGSFGTRLWNAMDRPLGHARMWRTSHTGGHRFAPTALVFPEGSCWSHLDDDLLTGLIARTLPATVAARHLRGCTAFPTELQVADRAIFAELGWEWLRYVRDGKSLAPNHVRLMFEAPNGRNGVYDAYLERGREVPVPDCGADLEAATKHQTEFRITDLRLRRQP